MLPWPLPCMVLRQRSKASLLWCCFGVEVLNPKECEQRKGNRIVAKALFSCGYVMAKCPKCSKGMHACALPHSLTDVYTCARRGLLRWYGACFASTSDLVFIFCFSFRYREGALKPQPQTVDTHTVVFVMINHRLSRWARTGTKYASSAVSDFFC